MKKIQLFELETKPLIILLLKKASEIVWGSCLVDHSIHNEINEHISLIYYNDIHNKNFVQIFFKG
jgi:hypothetical protein